MPEPTTPAPPFRSIPQMLQAQARKHADKPAVSYKKGGSYLTLSYDQLYTRVLMTARGLIKIGIKKDDRVAIFSENRAGWVIADLAVQSARAVSVPIYATNTGSQAAYVINHSGAKTIFISNRSQYEKLLAVRDRIPQVEHVISFERFLGEPQLPVYTLYQLSEISHPIEAEQQKRIEELIAAIGADDLITIIYTSGTTGDPKGAMLTQSNMVSNAWYGLQRAGKMAMGGKFLSFLPLSHLFERSAGYHAVLMSGGHIAFAESIDKVIDNLREVKPTAMISVPRLFEKLHARIHENVAKMSPSRQRLFQQALEIGREYVRRKHIDKEPTGMLEAKYHFYDKLVFRPIRKRFGGRLRFFICGGAPLDRRINEFMWAIGLPVYEGYGLTEASPIVTFNCRHELRFGSVGRALAETELKLAEDGELMVRGPQVMRGYYRDVEGTKASFAGDWFKTGDIAAIDDDGYVSIIDRKKEIIITSGGKNIPPQPLENELKLDEYLSQAYVHGNARPYLVALLTPDMEALTRFARSRKISYLSLDDLVNNREVQDLFSERVEQFNARQPTYQTIKRFALLAHDFSIEGGELTPTLKLKRNSILSLYGEKIEALYTGRSSREGLPA